MDAMGGLQVEYPVQEVALHVVKDSSYTTALPIPLRRAMEARNLYKNSTL